jgi:hypothetical protein
MQFDVFDTDRTLKTIVKVVVDFKDDVEAAVAASFAPALAAARTYNEENGCVAWVNEGGCIWTEGHPEERTYCA